MQNEIIRFVCLAVTVVLGMQSLADIAQQEAERRQQIDSEGVQAKVIEGNGAALAPNGNVTVSSPGARSQPAEKSSKDQKSKTSVRSYRAALEKMDRTIKQYETRLESLRLRLRSEKGDFSRSDLAAAAQAKTQAQMDELREKLEQVRRERTALYQAGKKEGYLPGELDGKGIDY
jgi:predicted RNase H-like nuclease (RuvC/YqgF family)